MTNPVFLIVLAAIFSTASLMPDVVKTTTDMKQETPKETDDSKQLNSNKRMVENGVRLNQSVSNSSNETFLDPTVYFYLLQQEIAKNTELQRKVELGEIIERSLQRERLKAQNELEMLIARIREANTTTLRNDDKNSFSNGGAVPNDQAFMFSNATNCETGQLESYQNGTVCVLGRTSCPHRPPLITLVQVAVIHPVTKVMRIGYLAHLEDVNASPKTKVVVPTDRNCTGLLEQFKDMYYFKNGSLLHPPA